MNATCTNTGGYRLTQGRDYEVIKAEKGYIFIENDNGTIARYDRKYFDVEEPVQRRRTVAPPPPPPPRTSRDVIGSIQIEGNVLSFIDINNENKSFENPLVISPTGMNISCGTGEMSGVNSLCNSINRLFNSEDGDFIDEKLAILRKCIQTWILENRSKAMWLCSTGVTQIDGDYLRVFDEMSGTRSEVKRNPNSGNDIKIWIFYPIFEEVRVTTEDEDDETEEEE